MTDGPLTAFLTCRDLDELATAYDTIGRLPDRTGRAAEVVAVWAEEDEQAIANVLFHPDVLSADLRDGAILRGLRSGGYLALAAAVGVGDLPAHEMPDGVRRDLLDALLDLVASDDGPAGVRAAAEIGPLLRAEELELLDDLAGHPVEAVRHNLAQAALGITDPDARRPVRLPYLPNRDDYAPSGTRPST